MVFKMGPRYVPGNTVGRCKQQVRLGQVRLGQVRLGKFLKIVQVFLAIYIALPCNLQACFAIYTVLPDINVGNFLVFSYIFASQFTHFCHKFIYICTSQFTHFLTNSSQHYTQFSTLLFVYFSPLLESILKSGLLSSALLAGKNLVGIVRVGIVGVGIVGVGIIAPTQNKNV